ncbi:MAG: TolC family outer membrane protein [Methylobacter sp.]
MRKAALLLVLGLFFGNSARAETLLEIFQLAEESDPQYTAVKAGHQAVLETENQAFGRAWLPKLSFAGRTAFTEATVTAVTIGGGKYRFQEYAYGLNLSQPLFNAALHAQLKQAESNVRKAALDVNAAYQDLMVRVAERYFGVLLARSSLAFAQAETAALSKQREQANARIESGLATLTDREEAQAGYDLAVAEEVQAQRELSGADHALWELIRQTPALAVLREDLPLLGPDPARIEDWSEYARTQNLGVLAAGASLEIAKEAVQQAKAGHLPTLDMQGSYGTTSNGGQLGNTLIDYQNIGVVLNVPLYEGGAVQAKVRENFHRRDEASALLEQRLREAERLAQDAYIGVNADLSRIKAMKQAVRSNEALLLSTRMGVEAGSRNTVDVVNAERTLYKAKRDHVRALHDYILDSLRLKQAAGTLAAEDLAYFSRWLSDMPLEAARKKS